MSIGGLRTLRPRNASTSNEECLSCRTCCSQSIGDADPIPRLLDLSRRLPAEASSDGCSAREATLSRERVVRYEWPGKFTEVYSPAHNHFRPSYFDEPELWSWFEIEFATGGSEARDRVVIRIRRKSDQVG